MKISNFNKINLRDLNLNTTLESGQVFVWEKTEDVWIGKTVDGLIVLKQPDNETILWQTYPENNNTALITKYLRLNFNTEDLFNSIRTDKYAFKAYEKYRGLRLLSQNFYETTISFIISANNNILAIRKAIQKMSILLGEKVDYQNRTFYLFPSITKIAQCVLDDLKSCSLRYRAEYVKQTANDLLLWKKNDINLPEEDIRKKLLMLRGVGPKVADCVLCYSLNFDNVTPLDVWGQRILAQYYDVNPKLSYEKMRNWTKKNFYGYAAWVGQYLFEYIRDTNKEQKSLI